MPTPTIATRGGLKLNVTETAIKSRDSEILPSDYVDKPKPPTPTDNEYVNMVMTRYRRSAAVKQTIEREGVMAEAFRDGNQWVVFRAGTNQLDRLEDPNDEYREFCTINKVDTQVEKIVNFLCVTQPTVNITAATPSAVDQGCADEVSDLVSHFEILHDWPDLLRSAVDNATVAGCGFIKHYIDPKAEALVWKQGAQGLQVVSRKVGEVCRCFVPFDEVYFDPDARRIQDAGWLIQRKRRSLEDIIEHYGDRGRGVEPDCGDGEDGWTESTLNAISGDSVMLGSDNTHSAYVYELWEKPSNRFPNGRRMAVAGKRLLTDPSNMRWPFKKKDSFPFVMVPFRKRSHSIWPRGIVHDLIPLQKNINTIQSRSMDKIKSDKNTALVPEDSNISTDSFHTRANFQKVVYSGDVPPQYITSPPVSTDAFTMISLLEQQMETIAGTFEMNKDQMPPGLDSGVAIDLWRQKTADVHAGTFANIEQATQQSYEWCISLASEVYTEPRLIAVGTSDDPQQNQIAAHDFRNLSSGGQVRVTVTPGSAIGKSPAAQKALLMQIVQAGGLQPQNLPQTVLFCKANNAISDDAVVRQLDALAERQMQLLEAQAAQQPPPPNPMQVIAAKHAADMEMAQAKSQMDTAGKLAVVHAQGMNDLQTKQQDQLGKSQMIDQEYAYETQQAEVERQRPTVTVGLKGSLGVPGTIGAEQAAGLPQTDTVQSMEQEQQAQSQQALALKQSAGPPQSNTNS